MKEISIRALHRQEPPVNPFKDWKPLKRFAEALDRSVTGRLVEELISEDRER